MAVFVYKLKKVLHKPYMLEYNANVHAGNKLYIFRHLKK